MEEPGDSRGLAPMIRSARDAACRFPMTRCRAARTPISAPGRQRRAGRARRIALRCIPISTKRAPITPCSGRSSSGTRATGAIDDRYCRDKLRLVEDFAAELFSHGESRAQFLKQQILDALELFASRLYSIESRRRAAARAGLGAAAPLRP